MFAHDDPAPKNENVVDNIVIADVSEESDEEDYFEPRENQCHLCNRQFSSKDDVFDHVKDKHELYYFGMLEVAERLSTNF